MKFHFFERKADSETEAGWTVSKKPELPNGDFQITAFHWPNITLWFVDKDKFDIDERQYAYYALLE